MHGRILMKLITVTDYQPYQVLMTPMTFSWSWAHWSRLGIDGHGNTGMWTR